MLLKDKKDSLQKGNKKLELEKIGLSYEVMLEICDLKLILEPF